MPQTEPLQILPLTRRKITSLANRLQPNYLFVYGTLKSGQPNHWRLQALSPILLGTSETLYSYPMLMMNLLPIVLNKKHEGQCIQGELYCLTKPNSLNPLDRLECHPWWYRRRQIPVVNHRNNRRYLAWLYFINDRFAPSDYKTLPHLSSYQFGGRPPSYSEL